MNKSYKHFILNLQEGLLIIKINKPDTLNALNTELINEFNLLLDEIENDKDINAVIITGEGKAFVAGADIKEMMSLNEEEAKQFSMKGSSLFKRIEELSKPVIAAINGFAIGGGCELALSCDIRLSTDKAKFACPEINLGIIPGFSGTKRLSNTVGISKAKELIFTGKTIDAKEAHRIKLVDYVYSSDELMNEAIKLGTSIKSKHPAILSIAKQTINSNYYNDIDNSIDNESSSFAKCFSTGIPKKYMDKFLNKK